MQLDGPCLSALPPVGSCVFPRGPRGPGALPWLQRLLGPPPPWVRSFVGACPLFLFARAPCCPLLASAGEGRREPGAWVVSQPWAPGAPRALREKGAHLGSSARDPTLAVGDLAGRSLPVTPAAWAL